jgi:hypothetical protein
MKKIWTKYSYSIILLICSFTICLIIAISSDSGNTEKYISITVNKGDTIWDMSEEYAGMYSMSKDQFIKWVENHNGITANKLVSGSEIVIPVLIEDENIILASE